MAASRQLKYSLLILTAGWLFLGMADEDTRHTRIREALFNYSARFPQQKAYLHLDKAYYYAGGTLWFKAYLVDGMFHRPDSFTTNLYVELITPAGTQARIIRTRMENGFGFGDFSLSDTLPEGLYQIRAYTNWMQNFHPDYFFSKNIQILNPDYKKRISPQQARKNLKTINKQEQEMVYSDIDVQFFPEGGDLVEGLESVVAFKAINKSGYGISIQGNVVDNDKNQVASIVTRHDGMGSFSLTPQPGKKYVAIVTNNRKEYRFNLPGQMENGISLRIDEQNRDIRLLLSSNRPPTNDRVANEVMITGQVRGQMCYQSTVNLAEGPVTVAVSKSLFPTGIVQFTLFSGRMVPLAERLVFVNHHDFININLHVYDTITEQNERLVCMSLNTSDKFSDGIKSNLSVAVMYDNEEEREMPDNILSHLLITSDLRGYIGHPEYYLRNAGTRTSEETDLLMLTHGWRKFDWTEILANDYPKVRFVEEKGITIAGIITSELFSIPLKNCKVKLSVSEEFNDIFIQQTDKRGMFKFENMSYYDTMNVKIEAWRASGKRNLVILVPDDSFAEVTKQQGENILTIVSERDKKAYRKEQYVRNKIAYDEQQRRMASADSNKLHGIHGEPDAVIRSEDIPSGYSNALQALQGRVPGVVVSGNSVTIRGVSTFYGNSQPLYLVDGVPVNDVSSVLSIPVEDIDRIEIIKGPNAAIYGSRGGNGVIAIFTKRGIFMKKGILEFQMLGYQWPRKFYQPAFTSAEPPDDLETIGWFPVVVTSETGNARLILRKPAIEGNLRIVIEGVSYEGQAGYANVVVENN